MNNEANQLVVSIAKKFMAYSFAAASTLDEAFLRFEASQEAIGITSIYRSGDNSAYFDVEDELKFEFYSDIQKDFIKLQSLILKEKGKAFCVCLVRIDADYNYKIYYEYDNAKKWLITKLGGQSGIPEVD